MSFITLPHTQVIEACEQKLKSIKRKRRKRYRALLEAEMEKPRWFGYGKRWPLKRAIESAKYTSCDYPWSDRERIECAYERQEDVAKDLLAMAKKSEGDIMINRQDYNEVFK